MCQRSTLDLWSQARTTRWVARVGVLGVSTQNRDHTFQSYGHVSSLPIPRGMDWWMLQKCTYSLGHAPTPGRCTADPAVSTRAAGAPQVACRVAGSRVGLAKHPYKMAPRRQVCGIYRSSHSFFQRGHCKILQHSTATGLLSPASIWTGGIIHSLIIFMLKNSCHKIALEIYANLTFWGT